MHNNYTNMSMYQTFKRNYKEKRKATYLVAPKWHSIWIRIVTFIHLKLIRYHLEVFYKQFWYEGPKALKTSWNDKTCKSINSPGIITVNDSSFIQIKSKKLLLILAALWYNFKTQKNSSIYLLLHRIFLVKLHQTLPTSLSFSSWSA